MAPKDSFHYEIEHSELDPPEAMDSRGNQVTTIKCHGILIAETRPMIETLFHDTPFHGHIFIDLSDVNYLDSAGLGALIRLKLSALKEPGVSVKFVQMTPRIMELLKIANLIEWFSF